MGKHKVDPLTLVMLALSVAMVTSYSAPLVIPKNIANMPEQLNRIKHYLTDMLFKSKSPENTRVFNIKNQETPLTNVGFSWENCGVSSDPIQVSLMNITPEPIPMRGEIYLTLNVNFSETITKPLKMDVMTQKLEYHTWFKIPCYYGYFGSCIFDDICTEPAKAATLGNQSLRRDVHCECPLEEGNYDIVNYPIKLDLPYGSVGTYRSTINFSQNERPLGCYILTYTIMYAD